MAQAKRMQEKKSWIETFFTKGEWPVYFILTLFLLLAFGLIALFSASHVTAYVNTGDSYDYIRKQAIFAAVGIVAMFAISVVDYHVLHRWVFPLYAFGLFLLALVAFTCDDIGKVKRWLYWEELSFLPTVQVSEMIKFVVVLTTAQIICSFYNKYKKGFRGIIYPVILTIPFLGFLYKQPHLSAMVIILGIVAVMILMSGIGMRYLIILAGLAVPAGFLFFEFALDTISYASSRLEGWTLDVTKMKWQTMQSVYAIGSGGLTGLGFGNGVQKQMWLPEATNDFIFSVICEELGFFGAMLVILLFVVFIAQGFYIALEAADLFGTLIAVGISAQIGLQFVFNIGVVTSLLPNTGISLPFFSSGGTSLLMLLAEIGVMISIARAGKQAKQQAALQQAEQQAQAAEQPQAQQDAQMQKRQPQKPVQAKLGKDIKAQAMQPQRQQRKAHNRHAQPKRK